MGDDYLRGGALMLAATVFFSLSDTMAKYVTESVPVIELATIRYAVFVAMATAPLLRNRSASIRSRRPGLQIMRGIMLLGSAIAFILSLGSLPVAEATAINFITPLMITVLAVPFLGEVVRPQGWVAVSVGFIGVLVVVRPGVGGLHPAAGLVIASSLCWCIAMLVTRRLVSIDRAGVTLIWSAASGFVLLLCALPFFLAPLSPQQAALCVLVGVVASSGQWLALLAYRSARATVLAPLSYAQLIWSSVFGFFAFGAVPDGWTLAGAVIIALSGTYVVHLERVRIAAQRTGTALAEGKP